MPVSGNEESGVIARQSSNCSAGVPIKKRRFPLIRPPSPPPQEPPSLPAKNDSLENKHFTPSQSQESSLLDASVAAISPGSSDASKNSFPEVKKETHSPGLSDASRNFLPEVEKETPNDTNFNPASNSPKFPPVIVQERNLAIESGFVGNVEIKDKVMRTEKSPCQKIAANTEMRLAHNEAVTVNAGREILSGQQVERVCKLELSMIPSNAELSLRPKELRVPALVGQSSEGSRQMPDKLDISSSERKHVTQVNSNDANSNIDITHVPANRSNWDLNTTMDAWEGSESEAAGQGIVGNNGLNETSGAHDAKPFTRSTKLAGFGVDTGKLILGLDENRSNFLGSSLPPSQQYKSEDSLRLSLSPSFCQSNLCGNYSSSLTKLDSVRIVHKSDLLEGLVSTGNTTTSVCRTVKSEPYDDNAKHHRVTSEGNGMGLLDSRTVKQKVVDRHSIEAVKLSIARPHKLVVHRSIKSEPVQKGNQEANRTKKLTSQQSVEKVVQNQDGCSTIAIPLTPPNSCPSELPSGSESCISGDVSHQSEHSNYTKEIHTTLGNHQEACGSVNAVAADMVSLSVGREGKESNVYEGKVDSLRDNDLNVDAETSRLKLMDELPLDSLGNIEGSGSDEEKINISADMLDEDPYDSDYESDGNHALATPMDAKEGKQCGGEDDEYEDGEVREPVVDKAVESSTGEDKETENVNHGDSDNKKLDLLGSLGDGNIASSLVTKNNVEVEDRGEKSGDHMKECDTIHDEKADKAVDKDGSLQDSLMVEVAAAGVDEKRPIEASLKRPLDLSGREDVQQCQEKDVSWDGATDGNQGTLVTVVHAADENVKGSDAMEKANSTLFKTEASLDGNANPGSNRSRIITLPRASNVTSPVKTRSIPGRLLPSRTGRERYTDYGGEKLHPPGNRDEIYSDGPRKFVRDRIHDRSFRNSRPNFMRGRGRFPSRLDTLRGEWDSDHDYASETYNGQASYRFPRHKQGYVIAPDGGVVGGGRGGRKPLTDEMPSFRRPSSRRLSPGGRDGPETRGVHMARRLPREISPSRFNGEDGSDLFGPSHGEKLMRELPDDDIIDPVFTRPQTPYQALDGQFVRGNRNFPSLQRRGPRIRSKSPMRSRTRSPGAWSSPRRRSPGEFNGFPELTQRRSPGFYRMERMRSPDRPCFAEDLVVRRRDSPPFVARPSNDLMDMGSRREHGPPRSAFPTRRSPSDRVLPRNNRRFDILDPRERPENREYFGGPIHTGKSHELGGDGNGDERQKCGERREFVRSFRPPYNGADDENYHFHEDDGPRPFRFRPGTDTELMERGNLREREFDRHRKNQPVIPPRRFRNMEEQEGNFRQSGPVWDDDGFDDGSRVKRRRF